MVEEEELRRLDKEFRSAQNAVASAVETDAKEKQRKHSLTERVAGVFVTSETEKALSSARARLTEAEYKLARASRLWIIETAWKLLAADPGAYEQHKQQRQEIAGVQERADRLLEYEDDVHAAAVAINDARSWSSWRLNASAIFASGYCETAIKRLKPVTRYFDRELRAVTSQFNLAKDALHQIEAPYLAAAAARFPMKLVIDPPDRIE